MVPILIAIFLSSSIGSQNLAVFSIFGSIINAIVGFIKSITNAITGVSTTSTTTTATSTSSSTTSYTTTSSSTTSTTTVPSTSSSSSSTTSTTVNTTTSSSSSTTSSTSSTTTTVPTTTSTTINTTTTTTTTQQLNYTPCSPEWVTLYWDPADANLTKSATCGSFTVILLGMGQGNPQGETPVNLSAGGLVGERGLSSGTNYYYPGQNITLWSSSGPIFYVYINNTLAGLYWDQRWAHLYLSSNVPSQAP